MMIYINIFINKSQTSVLVRIKPINHHETQLRTVKYKNYKKIYVIFNI